MIKSLDHINLSVKNYQESLQWYQELFDFTEVEKGEYSGRVFGIIKSGAAMLCMYEDPSRDFMSADQLKKQKIHGINHFALRIIDHDEFENRIKQQDIKVKFGGAYRYPHSTSWYIADPTGYEIELVKWDADEIRFNK